MTFNVEEELKKLPAQPGVYIMHGDKDEIIYVGKAISLKNRVRQYFQSSRNKGAKIERMVTKITRFEYIVTDSELEALVLECNLIKEHRPKYNTMLKDDKTYPFIKVTMGEAFPRILFSRKIEKDKSKYYGPYTSTVVVKEAIELMRKMFKVRSCRRNLPRDIGKDRPCLYYQIGQCDAPCQGYISQEEYRTHVNGVLNFLGGGYKETLKDLEQQMQKASEELRFEDAAGLRDLMYSVQRVGERQKITDSDGEDKDVLALAVADGDHLDVCDAVVQVFFIRQGKLIGRDHFYMNVGRDASGSQILSNFVKQYYSGTPFIPRELMLQYELEDSETIEQLLTQMRGSRVYLRVPKKGSKEKMVELARENARMVLAKDREKLKREAARTVGALAEIGNLLELPGLDRIEAYDISNTNGFESVGSMIVYEQGKPKRSDYRKFRIKTVQGPNDYASMKEVLTRRFQRGIKEREERTGNSGFIRFPDLLMMDGGRGQVNIAYEVLDELGLSIPVCGMVKDDHHRTRGLYYLNKEIPINRNSEAFRLITRIQDEAHRFAIEYHRLLRSKGQVHSILDEIKGVGQVRRKALMKHFQSLEKIREASEEELAEVPGMNAASARSVYLFFHSSEEGDS